MQELLRCLISFSLGSISSSCGKEIATASRHCRPSHTSATTLQECSAGQGSQGFHKFVRFRVLGFTAGAGRARAAAERAPPGRVHGGARGAGAHARVRGGLQPRHARARPRAQALQGADGGPAAARCAPVPLYTQNLLGSCAGAEVQGSRTHHQGCRAVSKHHAAARSLKVVGYASSRARFKHIIWEV